MNDHRQTPRHAVEGDPLGAMLREWRRRSDEAADSCALVDRCIAELRSESMPAAAPVDARLRGRWAERSAWFTAGIAAAAAVAVAVALWPAVRQDHAGWPPSVRFAESQVAEKAALVAVLEETFAGDLAWVAEHDRRVDVGLVPVPLVHEGDPVAVRIVVLSRRVGEADWRAVWQSDVVVRDEQIVDVAAGPTAGGRLRLWTHPLPDGAIAVDGELTLADAEAPLRASYSGVQMPGEPRLVDGDRIDGVEWQVIQTVVPLGRKRPAAPAGSEVG